MPIFVWLDGESYEFDRTQIQVAELREILCVGTRELWHSHIMGDFLLEDGDILNLYSGITLFTRC